MSKDIETIKNAYLLSKLKSKDYAFTDISRYMVNTCHISENMVFELCFFCQMLYVFYYDKWLFEFDGARFIYPFYFEKLKDSNQYINARTNSPSLILDPTKLAIINTVLKVYSCYDVKTLKYLISQEVTQIGDLTIDNIKRHYARTLI